MSSVILSQAGKFIGGSLGGPFGAAIGQELGSALGKELDKEIFKKKIQPVMGPRLSEITLQTATYGRVIPIVYGTVKLAGNIIWATQIKEHREDYYQRQSKFGSKSLVASQFNYSISLAIAIAQGEVSEILRVWMDDKLIDPRNSNYRFYKGDENQMPDPLIEAHCGFKKTPAFRGIAYIVIEDLPLKQFGNHIPTFLFEVKRKIKTHSKNGEAPLEERIKAMVMIPGSGEFVYDTVVQSKVPKDYNPKYGNFNVQKTKINQNNRDNKADCLVSLQQLSDTCPNLEWVAPVVGWFTSSVDAINAKIYPGVEFKSSDTLPDKWKVADFDRASAHLVSKNKYSSPIYGGTVNDLSILRYLDAIKTYKYKIMFYPIIFVDKHDKPWRGRITGSPYAVKKFFYGENGYNNFILHYARLVKDKVDAFIIGSELIGLTKIKDKDNNFPAVEALIHLAKQVKEIMGKKVKITYAADWSEYHHTEEGWYNLDPLWASDYIDFIGIDAYFPLTNSKENFYSEERIIEGWESGEGYDYYYEDNNRSKKKALNKEYAWKNIRFWWENEHINPDGSKTAWRPKQKKVWFTEIGFPSIDLASNQPNVFYSPDSVESNFPIHSKGTVDFVAQRQALSASEKYWRNSEFIEQMFIWTWDAKPYPFWPDMSKIWGDGGNWLRGHWVNGKLGLTGLQAIIQDICLRAGLESDKIRVEELTDLVDGIVISHLETARDVINLLKEVYFFDTHESNGLLYFNKRANSLAIEIKEEDLISCNGKNYHSLSIKKRDPNDLVQSVSVHYFNYLFDYQLSVEFGNNYCSSSRQRISINLPVIIEPQKARTIAEITLQEIWHGQFMYSFTLSQEYLSISPNDIIHLKLKDKIITMKVINCLVEVGRVKKIKAISVRQNIYRQQAEINGSKSNILFNKEHFDPGVTELFCLKLPKLPYEIAPFIIYLGVIGGDSHWRGAEVLCPDNSILYFPNAAICGMVEGYIDDSIELLLFNGELLSKDDRELSRYANLAAIGDEVIQFGDAEFLGANRYRLSKIKRNMFDSKTSDSKKFVLIDNNLQKFVLSDDQVGKSQEFWVTSIGHNIEQAIKMEF
jgi:hypothetical protein